MKTAKAYNFSLHAALKICFIVGLLFFSNQTFAQKLLYFPKVKKDTTNKKDTDRSNRFAIVSHTGIGKIQKIDWQSDSETR